MGAGLWFWAIMWLLNLVMLNMLLAIILDTYGEVKSLLIDGETLYQQSKETFRRWRQLRAGKRVSFGHVLKILDPQDLVDDDDKPENEVRHTVDSLVAAVPHLGAEQAKRILLHALPFCDAPTQRKSTVYGTLLQIRTINEKLSNHYDSIERLLLMTETTTSMLVETDKIEAGTWGASVEERLETEEEDGLSKAEDGLLKAEDGLSKAQDSLLRTRGATGR